MNRNVSIGIFILVVTTWFGSCRDEYNSLGKDLVETSFRNIYMDTGTVKITAVQIDSLETSGTDVLWVGRYIHPVWGTHTASGYTAYNCPTYSTDADAVVVFDSLMLNLVYNSSFTGDTTWLHKIDVHRLMEKIELNDNGYLYNNSSVLYDPEVIGSLTFKPRPVSGDTVKIRLSDQLGKDLLESFHARDLKVSADRFSEYFKGLAIVPDETVCQSFLAFSVGEASTILTLYYHTQSAFLDELTLTFTPVTSTQFNRVLQDRNGTPLENYPEKGAEVPSEELGNHSFLCGLTGWYSRLEFPYLNNILDQGKEVEIQKAHLLLYPEMGTYSDYNLLPDSIFLYIADENNVTTDAVKDYLGDEVQTGTLVSDKAFPENTYYYFDVTQFMQDELGAEGRNKHNLQLVFSSTEYTGTFRNMTFGDQHSPYPVQLQLTYKIYESY
ncbi:DUF4270 family protein [Parabacteroides pacaensis]|uniref:DUF4270 family protein n=1 Tax=Parabacteroides pacaensis TaxID=2086575 RepID=UPI000D0E72AE|nr:DUF4270 family protein [Parabacteroides pacaensis]